MTVSLDTLVLAVVITAVAFFLIGVAAGIRKAYREMEPYLIPKADVDRLRRSVESMAARVS